MYIYPDNLKAKPTMWLWALRDVAVIGIGLLISVFALARLGIFTPVVLTAVYTFLTIRMADASILDFIRYAFGYFFGKPQTYHWRQL